MPRPDTKAVRWPEATCCFLLATCIVALARAAWAQQAGQRPGFKDCAQCPEMVVLPAGEFLMGSTAQEVERELAMVPEPDDRVAWLLGITNRQLATQALADEQPKRTALIAELFASVRGKHPAWCGLVVLPLLRTDRLVMGGRGKAVTSIGTSFRKPWRFRLAGQLALAPRRPPQSLAGMRPGGEGQL